ncbi:MAG TPA: hypothetical protein VD927_11435 [Chryseosolibacter sp.]|nr:hypothetical protein [Chryseosolibacter sp.]
MFAICDLPFMPIIRTLFVLLALTAALPGYGQLGSHEKSAIKNIEKQNWPKAKMLIRKLLSRDSADATAKYLYTRWFFDPLNPQYNIDSASYYLSTASKDYFNLSPRERARLAKLEIDSLTLTRLRYNIDSVAFEKAKLINTEGAFLTFLSRYPDTRFDREAKRLRDEAAYNEAVRLNTYQSFLSFLDRYPQAFRATEARDRYERLFFESKTRERTLKAYESFLAEHPATPYRREVEQQIFNIITAGGTRANFEAFLTRYPESWLRKRATDLLFHIVAEEEDAGRSVLKFDDSLSTLLELNRKILVPFLKDHMFGFMDIDGAVILDNKYGNIAEEYLCGNVTEDILILNGQLTNRSGDVIAKDTINEIEDLGYGFLKITTSCLRVIHKSGFLFSDCIENAKIIAGRFVALKQNNKWSLRTFTGSSLTSDWDEIDDVNGVIIFKKENQWYPVTPANVSASAENTPVVPTEGFPDIRPWSKNLLLVSARYGQGMLDTELNIVLPVAERTIEKTFFGMISREGNRVELFNSSAEHIGHANDVKISKPWIAVEHDSSVSFFDLYSRATFPERYDSISFVGMFAVGYRADSLVAYFDASVKKTFGANTSLTFLSGRDSTGYLVLGDKNSKSVFSPAGDLLFKGDYDGVQFAGEGLFVVIRKEKKGLITATGKTLLPIEYDAIGSVNNNVITFLKSMKFGAYHVRKQKLIKSQFDKNIIRYTDDMLASFRNGSYYFTKWDGKIVGKSGFDEISYWNDSTALVRKGKFWSLYNIYNMTESIGGIDAIEYVKDTDRDKVAIFHLNSGYGVWNNHGTNIISPDFSALINVGSKDEPVYFTEKHVEVASIYVVIYYDRNGRMLRRQVYEEGDYERILCPD